MKREKEAIPESLNNKGKTGLYVLIALMGILGTGMVLWCSEAVWARSVQTSDGRNIGESPRSRRAVGGTAAGSTTPTTPTTTTTTTTTTDTSSPGDLCGDLVPVDSVICGGDVNYDDTADSSSDNQQQDNQDDPMKDPTQYTSSDWVNLGKEYIKTSNLADALKCFNNAITQDPTNTDGYLYRGYVYAEQSKFDKAMTSFSAAYNLDPSTLRTIINWGKDAVADSDYLRALAYFKVVTNLEPANWEGYLYESQAFLGLGNTKQFEENATLAASIDLNATYLKLTQWAKDSIDAGLSEQATQLSAAAAKINEDGANGSAQNTYAYFLQGVSYYLSGDAAKAKEYFKKGNSATNYATLLKWARTAADNKDYTTAVFYNAVAIELNKYRPDAYIQLGDIAFTGEDYATALQYYKLAYQRSPTTVNLYNRAKTYAETKDYPRALADLKKTLNPIQQLGCGGRLSGNPLVAYTLYKKIVGDLGLSNTYQSRFEPGECPVPPPPSPSPFSW